MPAGQSRRVTITVMGITQILAWGSSYYLPAVLAAPIARDTGWPLPWVVGGLSCGLFVAGLFAPMVGRAIQQRGGRPVLAISSLLLAIGLAGLALSPSLPFFLASWAVIGAGMSAGLYDAAFATAGRFYGKGARRPITALTLFGGFASTLCWPLSAYLVEAYGWRGACLTYAGIHILISLPLHLLLVPNVGHAFANSGDDAAVPECPDDVPAGPWVFALLALILTTAALISSMLSVHLLTIFQLRGFELAAAVGFGALIGPSQVGARLVEMVAGRNYHPLWTMLLSVALIASGVGLLLAHFPIPALALILYGAGNGLHTIARGALPLVLFDPRHYALFMGRLALPSLIVQALAPMVGAWLLVGDGTLMLAVLAGFGLLNVALCLLLGWHRTRKLS